jgi:hypothetical protein
MVSLPAVIVQGRRAKISRERYEWETGRTTDLAQATILGPGDTYRYEASVEFQSWMQGARITVEALGWSCNVAYSFASATLTPDVLSSAEEPLPLQPTETAKLTTGDVLARSFPFVLPNRGVISEADIISSRDRSLVVYYRVGRSDIEPDYGGNRLTLGNLTAAVSAIMSSGDSSVSRLVVAGFASPEGGLYNNERLAWNRAVSVKEYVVRQTGLDGDLITVYNGSEDWFGLREMVQESDMFERERVLRIIDTVPALSPDGSRKPRLERLQALDGGRTYRYMLDNFFPRLRNGAFIQIYYDDK